MQDRRKRPQLTIDQIAQASTLDGKTNMLSDGASLYLQVQQDERKYWVVKYKCPKTRAQRNHSVGGWPDITPDKARLFRDRVLKMVGLGIDPAKHKSTDYVLTAQMERHANAVDYMHDLIYTKRMIF